jgi:hypothetical protein
MMLTKYLKYIQYILIIIIGSLITYHAFTRIQGVFLLTSLLLVLFSLVNFITLRYFGDERNSIWSIYAGLLLLAMIFGSLGDFAMPGFFIFPLTDTFINGIIYFGIGHAFYLLALRKSSPLLFEVNTERRSIKSRNLILWLVSIFIVILLFLVTVYNPSDMVISIGAFGYGILLITVLAFAITKWFDDFPLYFKVVLVVGFLLFFISDWALGVNQIRDSAFMSGTAFIGFTYAVGQLLIQSSTILGNEKSLNDTRLE